jgi:hypothetical protein
MAVLVSETWAGTGTVNGKTPTTGNGTWLNQGTAAYGAITGGRGVSTNTSAGEVRHSATYTNSRIVVDNCRPAFEVQAFDASAMVHLFARLATGPYSPTSGTHYSLEVQTELFGNANSIRLYKCVAGTYTSLGYLNLGSSFNTVGKQFYLQASGSRISCGIDGFEYLSVNDGSISAAGFTGVNTQYLYVDNDGSIWEPQSFIGPISIETTLFDVQSVTPGKAVTKGLVSAVGIGYLGAADIALIAQSVLATLNVNTIPVDVQRMNSAEVIGTGTTGDAWRGVGVSP